MPRFAIHDFPLKGLNPEEPKEYRIHFTAQTERQALLPLWLSERKTPRDIVHFERRSNLCDMANFL
jgi:hypothetical protein